MKCNHRSALIQFSIMMVGVDKNDGLGYQIKCERCKKFVGDNSTNYPLPKDFNKFRHLKIKYLKSKV